MAKGKELNDVEAAHLYSSILKDAGYSEASELNKALLRYEMQAKLALIDAGYMNKTGAWEKGFDADALIGGDPKESVGYYIQYEELNIRARGAVTILVGVRKCRENSRLGKLDEAVLCMEMIVEAYQSVRKGISLSQAGRWERNQHQGIKEAIKELYEKQRMTAHQMWNHFRVQSTRKRDPEHYKTNSGITIVFEPDPAAASKGYLCEVDNPPAIVYRTFQSFFTEVKKNLIN